MHQHELNFDTAGVTVEDEALTTLDQMLLAPVKDDANMVQNTQSPYMMAGDHSDNSFLSAMAM